MTYYVADYEKERGLTILKLMTNIVYDDEFAKAVFNYEAANDDELSLQKDDIIRILSKKTEDPGWWKGEKDGRVGMFPDNFVKVLPPSKQPTPKANPPPYSAKPDHHHNGTSAVVTAPATQVLENVSKNRPPGPTGKRPPTVISNNDSSPLSAIESNGAVTSKKSSHRLSNSSLPPSTEPEPSATGRFQSTTKHSVKAEPKPHPEKPPPSTLKSPSAHIEEPSSSSPRSSNVTAVAASDQRMRRNSVSASEFHDLKAQLIRLSNECVRKTDHEAVVAAMQQKIDSIQSTHNRELRNVRDGFNEKIGELISEIDELRKVNAAMKVDFERMKKLQLQHVDHLSQSTI